MKRRNKGLIRGLAVLLSVLMIFSSSGITVFAEEIGETVSEVIEADSEESIVESTEASDDVLQEDITNDEISDMPTEDNSEEISEESESVEESSIETTEEIEEDYEEQEDVSEIIEDFELIESPNLKTSILYSGDWGESVHWTIDSYGVLTITQDEDCPYEYFTGQAPWEKYEYEVNFTKIVWGANCLREESGGVKNAFDMLGVDELVILECVDTSYITNMDGLFSGLGVTELDLTHIDTSNVTDMGNMFKDCRFLKEITFGEFDTSKVIDMSNMFASCYALKELNLEKFDTSNVTDMRQMFFFCDSLQTLEIGNFNTSNVTNMNGMFNGMTSLESLDLSNFKTDNVTDMSNMFRGCDRLKAVDLSSFNTANVTKMLEMFFNCYALESLDLTKFDTSKVTDMSYIFCGCYALKELDLSHFDLSSLQETNLFSTDSMGNLIKIQAPINLSVTVSLEGQWKRSDTGEITTILPYDLTESITIERIDFKPIEVTSIELSGYNAELEIGETFQINVKCYPVMATNKKMNWKCEDESIASVDENGLVTARKKGSTRINISPQNPSQNCNSCYFYVDVSTYATDMEIKLDKPLNVNGEYVLQAGEEVKPIFTWSGGDAWPNISYHISNNTIKSDWYGNLSANEAGSGTLTARAYGIYGKVGPSASLNYRVYAEKVSGIILNESKVVLDAQSTKSSFVLEAAIENSDVAYGKVAFTTNNPALINIKDNGDNTATITLTDGSAGSAIVTATAQDGSGQSAQCTIISGTSVDSITVSAPLETDDDGAYLLSDGKTVKLTAGILPSNATVKTVIWECSDESVAKVDSTGKVTTVGEGLAFIYAKSMDGNDVTGAAAIRVTHPAKAMKLELVGGENGKVQFGAPEGTSAFSVNAVLTGENGATEGVSQSVVYSLSGKNAKNVTYYGNGNFVAKAPGVVTVTATAKDGSKVKSSMQITIEQQVFALDAQPPKKINKYVDSKGEHWLVYLGSKDVTVTPVVTYNNGSKEYAPANVYKNYNIDFAPSEQGTLAKDSKGTGILISKDTKPGEYNVTLSNNGYIKSFYIDVVPEKETYIGNVAIALPKTVEVVQGDKQPLAEGSKLKLTGILNGGEKTKGYTMTWNVDASTDNAGTATVTNDGTLDLTQATAGDNYTISLTIAKDTVSLTETLDITVTKKTDVSALELVVAYDETEVFPTQLDVLYSYNGTWFKVAEQDGAANLYSVTGGKKGVLSISKSSMGYIISAEGTGSANITISALDGSNAKKTLKIKVVSTQSPINKITTGSKTYSIEPNQPIAIPYSVAGKNGKAVSDARILWTSSNEGILKVSRDDVVNASGVCITTSEQGYLHLVSTSGMLGKVTLTGMAMDGSKKNVKITVNVVNGGKKEVAYKLSLQAPSKTPTGGVEGLSLITHGKSVKLVTNLFPSKSKNKTVNYSIIAVDENGNQILTEDELKSKGVTVKKGVVSVNKKSSYTGFVNVVAMLDYHSYINGEAMPITASKTFYVQPAISKIEITNGEKVIKSTSMEAGSEILLSEKITASGPLTYDNVLWSVSNSSLAKVTQNGLVVIYPDAPKGKSVKVTVMALDGSKKKAVLTIKIQ